MRWKNIGALLGLGFSVACSSSTFDVAPAGDASIDTLPASDVGGTDGTAGDSAAVDSTTTDSSAGDDVSSDARPDSAKDAPLCDPGTFPTFDRGCTSDSTCSFGLHQVDCCGNQVAMGFNHSQKTSFDTAEAAYRAACPAACGCPMGPITTDSGSTGDSSKIKVRCEGAATGIGTCKTYVAT